MTGEEKERQERIDLQEAINEKKRAIVEKEQADIRAAISHYRRNKEEQGWSKPFDMLKGGTEQ